MKKAPNKSTLSYANAHHSWQMYRDLLYDTFQWCRMATPGKHKFRFKNKLLFLDSITISLCLSMFPWAEFRRTKRAAKLHLLLDHDVYLATYAYLSNGKKHDINVARNISLSAGSIVALDRGYSDYSLYAYWTENDVYFVTRLKDNADYTVIHEFEVPQNRNILSDQLIVFTEYYSQKDCPYPLRKIVVWDLKSGTRIMKDDRAVNQSSRFWCYYHICNLSQKHTTLPTQPLEKIP